jgi:hypothetical protein
VIALDEPKPDFGERLFEFLDQLTVQERQVMKSMMSGGITGFFDDRNAIVLPDEERAEQFHTLAEMLRVLTPHHSTIPPNGIAYYGRPSWATPEVIEALQVEAQKRRHAPLDRTDHYLGCGGAVADALSVSPELVDFVGEHVNGVVATGIASYLYYDRAGTGIRPHVDTDVFSVNLMLMLRHDHGDGVEPSSTVVFPARREPERYRLQVGEVMIMHGSSVIHTRTVVDASEVVHLLTIGFNPVRDGAPTPA